ncbi:MAG: hypothetical protein H0W07_08870 [Chloroflexi bacterium]|nr:hypothetical protein [Chloroflexota bacterium]
METAAFYGIVSGISFTLHGLWWVVVQSKGDWRKDRARRLLSYIVSIHFLLPGTMSLLSIIAPGVALVWQLTFAAAGALGVAGVVLTLQALRAEHDTPRMVALMQWVVLPVYAIVTLLALVPGLPGTLGLALTALQVEAIVVTAILVFGVQSAWVLMVEPPREAATA